MRAIIIDESRISRDGYERVLRDSGYDVTLSIAHHEVDECLGGLPSIDVVLLNLSDPRDEETLVDDFVGIKPIYALKRAQLGHPKLVGYTSFSTHHGLIVRSALAGLPVVYSRTDLEDGDESPLPAILNQRSRDRDEVLDLSPTVQAAMTNLGITRRTDIEKAINCASQALRSRQRGLSRRQGQSVREQFALRSGISARGKDGEYTSHRYPSWQQIENFWYWAAKVRRPTP